MSDTELKLLAHQQYCDLCEKVERLETHVELLKSEIADLKAPRPKTDRLPKPVTIRAKKELSENAQAFDAMMEQMAEKHDRRNINVTPME